jgi:diguanylate cyclase (GGDEF)-like protein
MPGSRAAARISRWVQGASAALDRVLYRLSVYGVPALIGAMTLMALFAWDRQYAAGGGTALEFRVLEQSGDPPEPAQALARLGGLPPVRYHDTRLSESPFWFGFKVEPAQDGEPVVVEIASRHASEASCWGVSGLVLNPLGSADRRNTSGRVRQAKTGFVLELGKLRSAVGVLCRATHAGPARITVAQWPAPEFDLSVRKFHRDSGLLDGGLVVLSLFVLVTAIINREWIYVLFAAWLIANLRLAALSAGWDTQWLERSIPSDWILLTRKLTIAANYVLTYTLFSTLFRENLKRVGYEPVLRLAQWSCVPLVLSSVILPFAAFLPVMWATVTLGSAVLTFFLARILFLTRSTVAMWYGASFAIALFATVYEVLAAALGLKGLIGAVNSVTAALASSLMAALAIAEQMRHEHLERVQAQAELRNTYEAMPIGLFTLDAAGGFLRGNPALETMLGADLSGKAHWSDHFEPGAWTSLQGMLRRGGGEEMELEGIAADGAHPRRFLVKATLAKDKIEGSLQDITERYKATARLRFLSENDPLTGVLNRRGIELAFERAMGAVSEQRPLALAYLDLDRFKLINDLFGHVAGDEVLRQVCARVSGMLAHGHEIGRIGGDEFVILFRDTPIRSATAVCRGIIEWIESSPYQMGDKAFQVKASIGLIEVAGGLRIKDAISAADRACREAKKGHHGSVVVYEKSAPVFLEREKELHMIEQFGAGVAPAGLFLLMQPIMSLHAPYDSLNFEILLRMREADGSITSAGSILSAAEANGHSSIIDRWVMSHTLEWLDTHYERLGRTRFVCMNLSGASLNDERFTQDAYAMLAQHGRAVGKLCIEITESVALHDLENTRRFINKVREFGAKVALDDFGAGYTSFNYLKELPADTLKIDGSFVVGVTRHPANLAIVEAIVELARNLGMKTVAEWAEDCATVEALAAVGVDYVQGFSIARPQYPDRILAAESSASFIEDKDVALFVRESLASRQVEQLLNQFRIRKPNDQNN